MVNRFAEPETKPNRFSDAADASTSEPASDPTKPRSFGQSMRERAGEAMDQKPSDAASLIRTKLLGFDPISPLAKVAGVASVPLAVVGETAERMVGQIAGADPVKLEKAARDTGDVTGDLMGILPGGKVAKGAEVVGGAAAKGAESMAAGGKTLAEGYKARSPEELQKISQGLGDESGQHYAQMRASGVRIIPEKSKQIAVDLRKELMSSGKLNEHLHGGTLKILNDMQKDSSKGFDVEDLDQYRRRFSEIITKSRLTGNQEDAFKAGEAIDAIDEQFSNLKRGDAPKEAVDAINSLKKGQEIWAKKKKFEAVSDIVQRSNGDPNRMKALFEQLLNNKKKMRGFTKDERALIKAASENTTAEGLMKMVGKLGITIGSGRAAATGNVLPALEMMWGMMGHGIGGGTAVTLGTAAKYGQKLAAQAKAEKVLKAIEAGQDIPEINTGTPLNNVAKQISNPIKQIQ